MQKSRAHFQYFYFSLLGYKGTSLLAFLFFHQNKYKYFEAAESRLCFIALYRKRRERERESYEGCNRNRAIEVSKRGGVMWAKYLCRCPGRGG